MKGEILSITTLFLFFPIIVFTYKDNNNDLETILTLLLLINIGLSILFWINPIEKSPIHFYDGLFAKISYIIFPIYILFVKEIENKMKLLFLFVFFLSLVMFYYSNNYSKNWCSKEHLICHSMFHFLISLGCSIAFI